MAGILGEGIANYVAKQINDRQENVGKIKRDTGDMQYFHTRTAWVKLASSSKVAVNTGLAKYYMLFNGKNMNSGIKPGGAYDTSDPDFGIVPTPGILSLDVKALNRGSIKEAHIKIKASSRKQFEDIDKVYLRLGFNMLIEWGWSTYVDGASTKLMGATLADNEWWGNDGKDYVFWLEQIKNTREKYKGNYDGIFGRLSNYTWRFNPDGSYDIDLKIISHGDVVESLRTLPPSGKLAGANSVEVGNYYTTTPLSLVFQDGGIQSTPGEEGIINSEDPTTNPEISPNKKYLLDISPIKDKLSEHLFGIQFYGWSYNNWRIYTTTQGDGDTITYWKIDPDKSSTQKHNIFINVDGNKYGPVGLAFLANKNLGTKKDAFYHYYKPSKENLDDEELPNITPLEVPTYVRFGYLLWYLNEYCLPVNKITGNPPFKIDHRGNSTSLNKDKPIPMYMPDQQNITLSYNPLKYIIRNPNHSFTTLKATCSNPQKIDVYENLENAIGEIGGMKYIDARNIYCNVGNLLEKIPIESNDQNETKIDIFGFLKNICNEINTSFGSVNNLEPVMDEDTNTLIIQDSTNFQKKEELLKLLGLQTPRTDYLLQMFGYRNFNGRVGSFVRNIDLETKISKETATLITIGATAKGSAPGLDSTAFSKLNEGTEDRFTTEYIDPSKTTSTPPTPIYEQLQEAVKLNFLSLLGYSIDANNTPPDLIAIDNEPKAWPFSTQDAQDKNTQLIKDYFAFHEAELHEGSSVKGGGPGIGFLPFELSLDMDGLSGIKIYNGLQIDSSFLPKQYPDSMEFVLAGVDHVVQNNDWITKLRVISTPKTLDVNLPVSTPAGTFGGGGATSPPVTTSPGGSPGGSPSGGITTADCAAFFKGATNTQIYFPGERQKVEASKKTFLDYSNASPTYRSMIGVTVAKLEGGHFHPLHHRGSDKDLDFCVGNGAARDCNDLANSGETLWGLDRVASGGGTNNSDPLKVKFWKLIDEISGFGALESLNNKYKSSAGQWKYGEGGITRTQLKMYKNKGMDRNDLVYPLQDPPSPYGVYPYPTGAQLTKFKKNVSDAFDLKVKFVQLDVEKYVLKPHFSGAYAPLRQLIESDVNLLFLWMRAYYNGIGAFTQSYAANIKKVWDSGVRDVKTLVCEDLKYRLYYNTVVKSGKKGYEPDIRRTIDLYRYWYY